MPRARVYVCIEADVEVSGLSAMTTQVSSWMQQQTYNLQSLRSSSLTIVKAELLPEKPASPPHDV